MKDYQCREVAAVMVINQIRESLPFYASVSGETVADNLKGYLASYDKTIKELEEIEDRS